MREFKEIQEMLWQINQEGLIMIETIEKIKEYLGNPIESQEAPDSSMSMRIWPDLTDQKINELRDLFYIIIKKKFTMDHNGILPIQVELTDRTRCESNWFSDMPYIHLAKTGKDISMCARAANENLKIARDQVDRVLKMIEEDHRTPKVGVGVFVIRHFQNEDAVPEILLSQRKSNYGLGQWSLPGGHVEEGEEPTEACVRELKEETGLIAIGAMKRLSFSNDYDISLGKHYITLYYACNTFEGIPMTPEDESDKHGEWKWFAINDLPFPIWQGVKVIVNDYGETF